VFWSPVLGFLFVINMIERSDTVKSNEINNYPDETLADAAV